MLTKDQRHSKQYLVTFPIHLGLQESLVHLQPLQRIQLQVEKQIIEQEEPIFMFIGVLLIAIVFVVSMTMQ